jgi:hypothetical protein
MRKRGFGQVFASVKTILMPIVQSIDLQLFSHHYMKEFDRIFQDVRIFQDGRMTFRPKPVLSLKE